MKVTKWILVVAICFAAVLHIRSIDLSIAWLFALAYALGIFAVLFLLRAKRRDEDEPAP